MKVFIIVCLITLVACLCFTILDYQSEIAIQARHIADQRKALDRVLTFKELQILVGAEPDGIIGPNTIAKWDKAICQQEASKWDYFYQGDSK